MKATSCQREEQIQLQLQAGTITVFVIESSGYGVLVRGCTHVRLAAEALKLILKCDQ